MVTSWRSTALSLQAAEVVAERVDEATVADVVGVGLAWDVLVAGRVAVMKRGVVLTGTGVEIEMQEVRLSVKTNRIVIEARMM
jgi:hypothetical protein